MNPKYKLILFDLDGVLIDSKKNMELSWSSVEATFELSVPFEDYFKLIGRPFDDIMDELGLSDQADQIKSVYDVASSCRLDLIDTYENCLDVVERIKKMGLRIGIVTSKDKTRTLEIIKRYNLLFDVVECPEAKERGKPNPDPLFRAMLKCQRDPSETLYIGDMDVDMEAARRAGIDYIHADWGYGNCGIDVIRALIPDDLLELII
ncbi:MAG: HAD family hydrolase [Candidatus Scalindua sp.]|jgi:phosphoglycolate phosphatase|nr:HAD family hydrolase [Candidatus Scalindua sp.]MBT6049150.1 HAD family hydrolase [Candidatus Scalindua sp.]